MCRALQLLMIASSLALLRPAAWADESIVTAKDRAFWAFQPPSRPRVPEVKDHARLRTSIDAFLTAALQAKGLAFAPDVDRYTLIRRATLDLTGLPPTVDEVHAFVADARPDAYERLLDRLLASPHFGERWGRHWLDAAGHVDVAGGDNDAATVKLAPGKWRYRDYVIRAYNQDLPFDRFLLEQLAGDELFDWRRASHFSPEQQQLLIATGFLRTASDDTDERELNTLDVRHGVLNRTVEVIAGNLLGMTLSCAKCHDHKFDPIPQQDYYRLTALFAPALNPDRWLQPKERALGDLAPAERAELLKERAGVDRAIEEKLRPYAERILTTKVASLPAEVREDTKTALQTPAERRNAVQKYLAGKFEARLKVTLEDALPVLTASERPAAEGLLARRAQLQATLSAETPIQAVYDVAATPTRFLKRGDYLRPGAEVAPGYLSVLCRSDAEALARPTAPHASASGRRLAFARWLTAPRTPAAGLVARVRVNRVWQHLFGVGLVPTSENLGPSGMRPSHPELLEWLAGDFIDHGWRLKPLLKTIMLSTAYRQSSAVEGKGTPTSADPDNRLLARQRLRRLESESVRDALLAVSGQLERTPFGPPLPLVARPDGVVVIDEKTLPTPTSKRRRSIYLLARRNYHLSLLNAFDQPVMTTNCTCRSPSAVVGQSLAMLNESFVLEQAGHLAQRLGEGPPEERVRRAYLITLSRPPRPTELALCVDFVRRRPSADAARAMTDLCHMLLNTNEFLYIP